jgi:hypothetical protein
MNLTIACTLVALISLIGAALKFTINRINWRGIQFSFRLRRGGKLTLYTNTWVAGATAAVFMLLAYAGLSITAEHVNLAWLLGTSGVLFGANTINWLWPATGAAGPTAAQVQNQDSVTVDVTTDGVTTTQTLTHNLNISAADIANGFPHILIEPNSATGIPATLLILITRPVTANAVVLTYAAVAATFRVSIFRPHTLGR